MDVLFVKDRPVPADWQAELERVVPRSDRVNWLKLIWEPGEPWEPVQRWEIREMVPKLDVVPEEILDALRGPDPRLEGRFVDEEVTCAACEGKAGWCQVCSGRGIVGTGRKVWDSPAIVSRRQWELYRDTGCYGLRFWIVQGRHGGHKWRFSPVEQSYLKSRGLALDTPNPGALPYADFDQRVVQKLVEMDRLRSWRHNMDWEQRQVEKSAAGLWVRKDRKAEEEEYAERMVRWLESQVSDLVDDLPRSAIPNLSDLPVTGEAIDHESVDMDLITNTSTEA